MATRRTFDPNAPEGPAPAVSRIPTFKCAAFGCKLAGGLNGGGADWWCAFHYAVPPLDLPRVTSILVEHGTVVRELVELLLGPMWSARAEGIAPLIETPFQARTTAVRPAA